MNMILLNEFINEKCQMIGEDLGIIVDDEYKNQMIDELLNNLKLIAKENNIDVNIILNNMDLIVGLDELIPYNHNLANEFLLDKL